ncbi:MAG: DUF4412 domain-containing protein [Ignavibacteria bacterium]|nr:DUF4412 domain-containing protein [Ignavibacteria bacterium]MBI3766681.1 DUF4412 domain-containing protein [Ignavibacteriales bacterium]
MKLTIVQYAAVWCLSILISVTVYGQGLYWESTMTGSMMGGKERTSKSFYMPKMFKEVREGSDGTTIVRLDKQLMITVNNKDKTYSEMTFTELEATMKKAVGKMDEKMAEMEEKLKDMPEEQRKMVEQMMGNKMPGKGKDTKVEISATGEKKTISGYVCEEYLVKQDGKELMTLWTSKDVKAFDDMRKDLEEFKSRMAALNPMGGKGLAEGMKDLQGFPIQTQFGQGLTSTVTKIEKRSTPASEFEVPAGYKKVKSKMFDEMEKE